MSNFFKEEYNCETGELKQIPMSDEEIAIWQAEAEKMKQLQTEEEKAKIARNAVLEKLGITEEEAALILG